MGIHAKVDNKHTVAEIRTDFDIEDTVYNQWAQVEAEVTMA